MLKKLDDELPIELRPLKIGSVKRLSAVSAYWSRNSIDEGQGNLYDNTSELVRRSSYGSSSPLCLENF